LDDLALNGLIQRFEFTIELTWKTLKDFLEEQGFAVLSPRETIRQGLISGYILNGQDWQDAIHYRNLLSHMYDEQHFRDAEQAIRNQFILVIRQLHQFLQAQL
jgi:nucleotidyltransferase substrate binding protein (TIGR01987 family)